MTPIEELRQAAEDGLCRMEKDHLDMRTRKVHRVRCTLAKHDNRTPHEWEIVR